MKKRILSLLLCMLLLFSCTAQADTGGFMRRIKYGMLSDYTNLVFGYTIGIYAKFSMIPEAQMRPMWDEIEKDLKSDPEADRVYDLRCWISPDSRFQFQIQVKEPTYKSFAVELENAPYYADAIAGEYGPEEELKQLHEGIVRETPMGQMLETAISYNIIASDGAKIPTVFLYYDCYFDGIEYIFSIHDFAGEYETAQTMLDHMIQTVQIVPLSKVI